MAFIGKGKGERWEVPDQWEKKYGEPAVG